MKISDAAAGFGIGLVTVYVAKLAMDGWRKTAQDLVEASKDTEFMIRSEDILTIADPTQEVVDKYIEITS